MIIFRLAFRSLYNRKITVMLTVFIIAISVILLLGVERIKTQTKENFTNTLSGTDLIVGARSGEINLLLYSVFHIGNVTHNINFESADAINKHPSVAWSIPISLGDSHRGFRVIGTTNNYFEYYQFNNKKSLQFAAGKPFNALFDTVIGAEVAQKLKYKLGDNIIIAHGLSDKAFTRHDKLPFEITGILSPTGTPVDNGIYVSLSAIEAIHLDFGQSKQARFESIDPQLLAPKQITAIFLGLKSKIRIFSMQRSVNQYVEEPLTAIIPNMALHEMWKMMATAEQALFVVSGVVVIAGLIGMLTSLLTSLNERRREMAILRGIGARPIHIFSLFISEACFITLFGVFSGLCFLYLITVFGAPYILNQYGFLFFVDFINIKEIYLLMIILFGGFLAGAMPAFMAYKKSLSDGMTIRV